MKNLIYTFGILLLLQNCGGSATTKTTDATASSNVAVVQGEAPIYQGDSALAKSKALKDAKLNAVRKIIGEQITQKTGVADGQSLGSKLYGKTDAFVKNYEILGEENFQLNTQPMLRLTVRCEVELTRLSTAVDQLLDDVGNPRMVVLVGGTIGSKSLKLGDPKNQAEAELSEALRSRGNKIVSSNQISNLMKKNPSLQNLSLDDIESGSPLVEVAQEAGAEVLVIAYVSSKDQGKVKLPGGKEMDILSSAVTGPYKMVQLWGDGKVFGSGSSEGRGADLTMEVAREKAIQDWAKLVGDKAGKQIKQEWFKLTEENTVILKFSGLPAEEAISFRDDLIEFTSVKQINERKSDVSASEWELTYPGKESMFSEELSYKKDRGFRYIGKYELAIVSSKRGEVVLKFSGK
ncbi:MAG: lipoprotein LipL46 [Leptospiraceae bacterium]|nr:lipoprotein LipL46 [Leptospiraceae bacterium]MCZ8345675.1 lipoprotein LipL46 [Leptospiraceae bacterium]